MPLDQGRAILIAEFHPARKVEPDVEVAARLARRVDGFFGEVHRPIGVGEGAGLLTPNRRGEDDVRQLGRLGEKGVLHDDEGL